MTLLDTYVQAAAASHRHLASLIVEALRLRLSQTRLGLSEYIDFQLYKTDIPWDAKAKFGGLRTQDALDEMLVDDYSRFLSLDKVTMYALLSGLGFPIPKVRATYRSIRPSCITQLHSPEQLEEFIATPGNLPIYVKRSFGGFGRGNVLIAAFDGTNIVLGNGARESAGDFCASLDDARSLGWILQEPLTSHPDIETVTGHGKISGLRVHTFLGLREAKVIKAIFKINAGLRDIDNFDHGNSGNMLAAVDVQSGTIVRAVSGVGVRQVELPIHPTTQAPLLGFKIPGWSEVVSLVTDAHEAFQGFLCPAWDIAICADGPKILEVNAIGDLDLPQHAYRGGFIDDDFIACLRERNLDHLLFSRTRSHARSAMNHRIGIKKHHWPW